MVPRVLQPIIGILHRTTFRQTVAVMNYTNCETCVDPMGNGVPWGPIQMISYPMANIPNDLIACGPQPGCVLEIYFRKRMCGDTVQMKVSGFKYVGCTANNCYCKEFISRNAHGTFVHAAAAGAFIENSFDIFNMLITKIGKPVSNLSLS